MENVIEVPVVSQQVEKVVVTKEVPIVTQNIVKVEVVKEVPVIS